MWRTITMWRQAVEQDEDRIIALCLELNREDPGPRVVPETHTRHTLATLRKEPLRGVVLVLEIQRKICGYAILISFWSNELGGEICTLDEFFVDPTQRSQGHGRHLLDSLIRGSSLWPMPPVAFDLEVTPSNARAKKFYESLGFLPAKNTHMRFRF